MNPMPTFKLYLITNRTTFSESEHYKKLIKILKLAPEGTIAVGLREPSFSLADRFRFGQQLIQITRTFSSYLIVHDRIDLALALDADGVQLGTYSLSGSHARALLKANKWIGCSCHNETEIEQAQRYSPDWILLSPVFFTPGKGHPLGLEQFAKLQKSIGKTPVIALGGMNESNATQVHQAGANAIGCIRAWLDEENDIQNISKILKSFL